MNELALFAGSGGGILGGHLLGWETVAACEIEDYPRETLLRRQIDGILPKFPIWDDINTFDGTQFRGSIDIISGGFPCQDISAAGKGAGIDGVRSGLWKEMHRIIGEVRPQFAFMENSPLLTSRGLGTVLGDLAEIGYDAEWCVLGADDIGAPHRRKRIWILAYSNEGSGRSDGAQDQGRETSGTGTESIQPEDGETYSRDFEQSCINVAYPGCEHALQGNTTGMDSETKERSYSSIYNQSSSSGRLKWWDSDPADLSDSEHPGFNGCPALESIRQAIQRSQERQNRTSDPERTHPSRMPSTNPGVRPQEARAIKPELGRVAHGVANRVDRLKAIGNGQVPAVAAVAFLILYKRMY